MEVHSHHFLSSMDEINAFPLGAPQLGLWFLGQAGYILRSSELTIAIDPYLTDSAAKAAPEFSRLFPPPLPPQDLRVDVYIVTHDHTDHLDPETLQAYRFKDETTFVAPRLAARSLRSLGVPERNLRVVNCQEKLALPGVEIDGAFALPTGADVLDTTGYVLTFANRRTVYHTSDTAFTPLLQATAPKGMDVLLVPINGKWGNLTVEQAVELASVVGPRFVLPHHYDLFALNSENPDTFAWLCRQRQLTARCLVQSPLETLVFE